MKLPITALVQVVIYTLFMRVSGFGNSKIARPPDKAYINPIYAPIICIMINMVDIFMK
jgi:hypothetical protein